MPIVDLYSNRQGQKMPRDVWVYDQIPSILRVQVSNIVTRALGTTDAYIRNNSSDLYAAIADVVAHEHGRASLSSAGSAQQKVHRCIQTETEVPVWLDCVELCFRLIERVRGNYDDHQRSMVEITMTAKEAVEELNERFRRAGFGYQYTDGCIFRTDSELTHHEITVPALHLLSDPRFKGADEEFLAAHAHFKAGEYKDCAVDALNALESTMKTICDLKKWTYPSGARATDLIKVLRQERLFPDFADQSFEQLVATLKSGLPSLRNVAGAHGQGSQPVQVPSYVASYALNLAAAKIRLLVELFRDSEA